MLGAESSTEPERASEEGLREVGSAGVAKGAVRARAESIHAAERLRLERLGARHVGRTGAEGIASFAQEVDNARLDGALVARLGSRHVAAQCGGGAGGT
jgi:hypothetical protein